MKEGKSGEGLGKNSKLPKCAQPVRVWKRKETGEGKNVKKETANEACFNKRIDGDAGKDVVCINDKCPYKHRRIDYSRTYVCVGSGR